jgi:hypothetical protein
MIEGTFTIATHRGPPREGYTVCLNGGGMGVCSAIQSELEDAMRQATKLYLGVLIDRGLGSMVQNGGDDA